MPVLFAVGPDAANPFAAEASGLFEMVCPALLSASDGAGQRADPMAAPPHRYSPPRERSRRR